MPLPLVRTVGRVVLERTVTEPQGIPRIKIQEVKPQRKSMAVPEQLELP